MVLWGRILLRTPQLNLNTCGSPQKQPQTFPIQVWEESLDVIKCWTDGRNLFKGSPLHPPEPQITLCTDASMEGWGAHVGTHKMYGSWSQLETSLHINVLEMRAVINALKSLNPPRNAVILLKSDNSSVVAYANKQGEPDL